jgi:hypothetical protein
MKSERKRQAPSNITATQASSYRSLWDRLLGYGGEELLPQRQPSDKTDLNVPDEAKEQPSAQKQDIHEGD